MARRKRKATVPSDTMEAPTRAQLENGTYERRFITHVETNTKAMAFVSEHDPVERWDRSGRLTDGQAATISAVRRLWALAGISQRVTASYGQRSGVGSVESRACTEIEAREDLHRIQEYVPATYWNVFENVCRWGMAAGVAGADLGFGGRSAQDRAHQIVVFVADIIAMKERW